MITPAQLHLLHHSLGLTPRYRKSYRNYFIASEGHHDYPNLVELERIGFMTSHEHDEKFGGNICFCVTDIGKEYAIENLPPAPKVTKWSQYLRSDTSLTFAEWLGIEVPKREYSGVHAYRTPRDTVRYTSSLGTGEWCKTAKEAKASYKQAIKARRLELSAV